MMSRLLDHRLFGVNAMNGSGETPLHYAVKYGRSDVAELLIEHGANVDAKDPSGNTPLHYCEFDAPTNKTNRYEEERVKEDLREGDNPYDAAKLLLEAGANPNAVNDYRADTPLHIMASHLYHYNHFDPLPLVELLIDMGANVNAINKLGRTPLHENLYAQPTDYEDEPMREIGDLLIARGARTDIRDLDGKTYTDLLREQKGPDDWKEQFAS